MITLDHTILRVRDLEKSIRFYQEVLGFKHEGKLDRFEIIRVHDGFTIDLVESDPKDQVHYAFCMGRKSFNEIHARLKSLNIPFGSGPHSKITGSLQQNGPVPKVWLMPCILMIRAGTLSKYALMRYDDRATGQYRCR
jgi:glyoxylase I family protein